MGYFVTGGTGFIGRHLIGELGARGATIWVLVRPGSRARFERLRAGWGLAAERVVSVEGDLGQEFLGIPAERRAELRGKVEHLFHLGALYDLAAGASELEQANVLGTRHVLQFAHDVGVGCLHLASSIAVAGRYAGRFSEDMFAEATGLDHPYFRTKHESEALVRSECRVPWRVYRPGMVVGHSQNGVMDKVDGPYYLFKLIQRVRDTLPRWAPLIGFEGGHINLVPVDFVARALVHLAHLPGLDGRCFHLTDPEDRRVGAVLNLFAAAAHAPTMTLRVEPKLFQSLAQHLPESGAALRPLQRVLGQALHDLGIPRAILELLNYPTVFDARATHALLAPAGIRVPRLEDYAWRLWDYWERHLDRDLHAGRSLAAAVGGRTVLVTGGSSGIGRATALRLARAGALVCVVARDAAKLEAVRAEITAAGGRAAVYACDIADPQACDRFIERLLADQGHVDILVNNAGRSIRRAIENSYDRLHDFERLMRLNYFAAVRVTLGLLPAMVRNGGGQVVSISSMGVLTSAARFSGYIASKAALEAFSRSAAAEFQERGVEFSVINMPLVRTPMVAPTRLYEQLPLITPEEAADLVCDAIIHRPPRIATRLGLLAQWLELLAPRIGRAINAEGFRMFPESAAAAAGAERGATKADEPATPEMVAFASLLRGIHW